MNRSVNKAKKEIWLRLQAYVGDDDLWESMVTDDNFHPVAIEKARWSIFDQLEKNYNLKL